MSPEIDPGAEIRALIVDDEKEVADAYALRLRDVCETEVAYAGAEALEAVAESTVDIVLLDRHMPSMSGDEVLERLRDRSFDGRIIMVTAVDPGFDVLDMPFDDYLCKPVDRKDLHAAVEHQRRVLTYEMLGAYFSAESKRAVLEAEVGARDRPEYADLVDRVSRLRTRVQRLSGDGVDPLAEFEDIDREGV